MPCNMRKAALKVGGERNYNAGGKEKEDPIGEEDIMRMKKSGSDRECKVKMIPPNLKCTH